MNSSVLVRIWNCMTTKCVLVVEPFLEADREGAFFLFKKQL